MLRGRFEHADEDDEIEWCHRRLLARIHRLTIQGLRQQIQPVSVDVFFRFLTEHHEVSPALRREGPNAVFDTVARLQGLEIAAASWENDVLPARIAGYQPGWLDELCLAGEIGWGRLSPGQPAADTVRSSGVTRVAPISLWLRSDLDWLQAASRQPSTTDLSPAAEGVLELIRQQGAMFAADITGSLPLDPTELRAALSELTNRGLLTADGFAGLRSLISGSQRSRETTRRRSLTRSRTSAASRGRWSLWRMPGDVAEADDSEIEQWAWQLLRRWGVVFRDLLLREPSAPRWYRILQCLRRLEARGEVRGGRFVIGVAGEQFAAAETVHRLRQLRDAPDDDTLIVLSATDPLNLIGVITPDAVVPRQSGNRIVLRGGVPVAAVRSGQLQGLGRHTPDAAIMAAADCPDRAGYVDSSAAR